MPYEHSRSNGVTNVSPNHRDPERILAGQADDHPTSGAELADGIVHALRPASALHVDCGSGWLVQALRALGVDAYGIACMPEDLQGASPPVQAYLNAQSLAEPLDRRFDLIICVDTAERLPRRDAEQALANLAAHCDDLLFSSSPFDGRAEAEQGGQPGADWASILANFGLYRDLEFDDQYLAGWAVRFRRSEAPVGTVVAHYERTLWRLGRENAIRRELLRSQRRELVALGRKLEQDRIRLLRLRELEDLIGELEERRLQVAALRRWQIDVTASPAWQVVVRLQSARARACPPGSRREAGLNRILERLGLGRTLAGDGAPRDEPRDVTHAP